MSMFYQQEDLISSLCRQTGRWMVTSRQGDCAWVQATDNRAVREIIIRDGSNSISVLFQAWFPIRFPLQNPPSGLFGKLLLRNMELCYCGWAVSIGESCEACPTVAGLVPRSALTPSLFDFVCREIRDEIDSFQKELHDKFSYDMGSPVPPAVTGNARYVGSIGQPVQAPNMPYIQNRPGLPAYRRPGG